MLLTRCPSCTTTFRVTPEQVKARHGQVRCGRCQHVFDAIEFLVDAGVPVAPLGATPATSNTDPALPTVEPIPAAPPEPLVEILQESTISVAPEAQAVSAKPDLSVLLQPPPSPLSERYLRATARTPQWPWAVAFVLTLLALSLQALLAFRVEIAVRHPDTRPMLEKLCGHFDCVVELPSDPNLVSIEASDLHPAASGRLELTATLKNRATHAQTWPYLELTLTDGVDKPIVRKIIGPEKFLSAGHTLANGFPANAELAVQLTLDAGELPAAGYRLYLFYP